MNADLNSWKRALEERAEAVNRDPRVKGALMERRCLQIANAYDQIVSYVIETVEEMVEADDPESAHQLLDKIRGQLVAVTGTMPEGPQILRETMTELIDVCINSLDEAERWVRQDS